MNSLKPTILKHASYSLAILLGCAISVGCADKATADNREKNHKKTDEHAEHSHDDEHEHTNHADHDEHKEAGHEAHEHSEHEEDVKHVGKHVHGEAELTAVIDGKALILQLNSPAMNVFGFEHIPSTDEQKAIVEKQETILNDASKLFTIDGGDCAVSDVDIDMPFSDEDEYEEGNDEEHEHEQAEDTNGHEENDHNHEASVHSDVTATYTYTCKDSVNTKDITVNVFSHFTGFTKINAKWVNADKQGATTLTKESYTISVK